MKPPNSGWLPRIVSSALVVACSAEEPTNPILDLSDPVATDRSLVYLDHTHAQVVFANVSSDGLELERRAFDEGATARWHRATLDGRQMLVLAGPRRDGDEAIPEQLLRFDAVGSKEPVAVDVGAAFDSVALSPDHRHAVLYFGGKAGERPTAGNQVAIVDLAGGEHRAFGLRGFGSVVSDVQFPAQREAGFQAPVEIGGVARDLAVFLAENEIVIVDMQDATPDARQVSVRLDAGGRFAPVQTVLRPANGALPEPTLFVRGADSDRVAVVGLRGDDQGYAADVRFAVLEGEVGDLGLVDIGGVSWLVAALADQESLTFCDIETGEQTPLQIGADVSRLIVRDRLVGDDVISQVVAWAPGGHALHLVDLPSEGVALRRAPRSLTIQTEIGELVRIDHDRMLISSESRLYVVDLAGELATPIIADVEYDPALWALHDENLVLAAPGRPWLVNFDLQTLGSRTIRLDEPIQSLHHLPRVDRFAAVHPHDAGHVTVLASNRPSRSTSWVAWSFLLEGVLERD